MTRTVGLLLLAAAVSILSGCGEFRIIGRAAFNELTCDAVNVERAAYAAAEKKPEEVKVATAQSAPAPAPAPKGKKKEQKKGIWEKN